MYNIHTMYYFVRATQLWSATFRATFYNSIANAQYTEYKIDIVHV